jgi:PTH1 family peptidyl-tRNA hydrolase
VKGVVGLGNPGNAYRGTRHNTGEQAARRFLEDLKGTRSRSLDSGELHLGRFGGDDLLVFVPGSFMNASGEAVRRLREETEVPLQALLVAVDDLYLPFGALRFRRRGGDGGHNGLTSIVEALGSDGFPRLRIGIGPLPPGTKMEEFVLGAFTPEEQSSLPDVLRRAAGAIGCFLEEGITVAMNRYNGRAGSGPEEEAGA